MNLENNLFNLNRDLTSGQWKSDPYTVFFVQDPKLRKIHKASVRDRVLYQAIYGSFYSIFDKSFIHDSYSSRLHKGTHRGVQRLCAFYRKITENYTKSGFVLKCDIKKFFDSVDKNILIRLIFNKIKDEKLRDLIKRIITSFENSQSKGLPLGNVTSQIFSNIYMNELDQFIKHQLKIIFYIRYCDDFVILSTDMDDLIKLIPKIKLFLSEKLKLELHPHKIQIRKIIQGVDFLGYVSLPHFNVLRTKTKNRILKSIERLIDDLKNKNIEKEQFNSSLNSYLGILSHCSSNKIKEQIAKML